MASRTLRPEFVQAVEQAFAQISQRELGPLTAERPLAELGLDSVSLVELVLNLEDQLDLHIPQERLEELRTFGDLQDLVEELEAAKG
jgi:acyl carrier protein